MIIFYVTRLGTKNADASYNMAWEGLWALAECSIGIIVTCTFLLPKFLKAEGPRLRRVLSSLTRSATSVTSRAPSRISVESKKDTTTYPEVTLDTVTTIAHSDVDLHSISCDQDVESCPSYEGIHDPAEYPAVNTTDTPH